MAMLTENCLQVILPSSLVQDILSVLLAGFLMVPTRGAESGVATSQESESESIKLSRPRLRNVLFDSVI